MNLFYEIYPRYLLSTVDTNCWQIVLRETKLADSHNCTVSMGILTFEKGVQLCAI